MNFLLYMLGQTHRTPACLRPTSQQLLRTITARALAAGNPADALDACRDLVDETHGCVGDTLVRACLHLTLNDYAGAARFFTLGLERIGDAPAILDHIIDAGEAHLRKGRYVRAIDCFQRARAAVDTLLAAQAGLAVATARQTATPDPAAAVNALVPLAKLGDLLLRMLARTHLASNLATCLKERRLREDLASWATSTSSVENLLLAELEQFQQQARECPDHAELHYRIGLVARTLGRHADAAAAFTRVLGLYPHHLPAAARLAATNHQLGHSDAILPILAVAFAAPPNVIKQFAALAAASANPAAFDRAAESFCRNSPATHRAIAKANLAFALSELGLLDDARAQWREPAVA